MSGNPASDGYGPTWSDVRTFIDHLGDTYGGPVVVTLAPALGAHQGRSTVLWVRVVYRERLDLSFGPERAVGGAWPSSDHRTMPGLIYKLCHRLERALEEHAHDRAVAEQVQATIPDLEYLTYQDPSAPDKGA